MSKYKVTIEVIDILGDGRCSMDQKIGTVYKYPEDLGKMCPSSLYILYPWIMVMSSGGSFTDTGDGHDFMTVGCSDYTHQVVYKISRTPVDE
ncbi:MAG: TIGR04076 family protein [Candidatus Thorarchaeota archaeon]|nr:TIGR04076 family protein [Candidatus Thorarchaeota archaeon]